MNSLELHVCLFLATTVPNSFSLLTRRVCETQGPHKGTIFEKA